MKQELPTYYILGGPDGQTPEPCDDMERMVEWAYGPEGASHRRVALDGDFTEGGVTVSTVFLVHDHRFVGAPGPPLVFETLVFGGPLAGEQERYSSWDEAIAGHQHMLERVRVGEP